MDQPGSEVHHWILGRGCRGSSEAWAWFIWVHASLLQGTRQGNTVSMPARQFSSDGDLSGSSFHRLTRRAKLGPTADVVGLFRRLRYRGPTLGALALLPQLIQLFNCGLAIAGRVRQITTHNEPGAANSRPAMDIDAAFRLNPSANVGQQLQNLSRARRHGGVRDRRFLVAGIDR